MSHAVGLDQVGHVGLVQHPDAGDHGVVRHAHAAHVVVQGGGDLASAAGPVTIEPVVSVPGVKEN